MKLDEFAFVNQQLASMLRDGIPLEGALRQLCATMQRGELRAELQRLEADLAAGFPLKDALARRSLPRFYVRMLEVGVQSNDLAGVLLMLADYYQRVNLIWVRLKGLMVYPLIVLLASLVVSIGITFLFTDFLGQIVHDMLEGEPLPRAWPFGIYAPVLFLGSLSLFAFAALTIPFIRRWLRWHAPGFREASLSQFAAAMALMLKGGCTLNQAISLLRQLEQETAAGAELACWQQRLASGRIRLEEIASPSGIFPQTFIWFIANAGENLADGFARAAAMYHSRAVYRAEILLYAALPVSVLFLGLLLALQLVTSLSPLITIVNKLGAN